MKPGDAWRAMRLRMALKVMKSLTSRAAAEVPARYVSDLTEVLHQPDVKTHVTECSTWTPALIEDYDFPQGYPLGFRRSHAFNQRFVYRLTDVISAPRSGAVWIPSNGRLLGESYGTLLRSIGWGDVRPDLMAPVYRMPLNEPVVLSPPTGYYHWLLEILPRVLVAHEFEPTVKAVVPTGCPEYITDALNLLGMEILETGRRAIQIKNVIVPSALQGAGFIPSADVERLRNSILPAVVGMHEEQPSPQLVYVSRTKDSRRKLSNERAVEDLMRENGFDVVYLQDLTWTEQIHRMSRVEVVVSPHGAGLANTIWSNALSTIIEIFPAGVTNDCYARLALQRGAGYSFLDTESDPGSSGVVNLQGLEQLIALALKK